MTDGDIIRAAGGVVCRLTHEKQLEVLLVGGTISDPSYCGFPKGRQNPEESIEATALREIREETGLHVELLAIASISRYTVQSKEGEVRPKMVRLYLARSTGGDLAERDGERNDVQWALVDVALEMITYEEDRTALRQAQFLIESMPLYRGLLEESL